MHRLAPSLALVVACALASWLGPQRASAQEDEGAVESAEEASEESAEEVTESSADAEATTGTDAPLPAFDDSDPLNRLTRPGHARSAAESERSAHGLLWIPRLLFAPLRFAVWLVTQPLAEIARLNDEHDFVRRFLQLFVSDDGTYGMVPTFFIETGFGLNAGLHAFHENLFGHGETIRARIGFGGYHRQHYQLSMSSGDASSLITVGGGVRYEVRNNDRFFGVGNSELVDPEDAPLPLSPFDRDYAVQSSYQRHTLLGELGVALQLGTGIKLRAAQRWEWSLFEPGAPQPDRVRIVDAYQVDRLVGFETPQTNYATELRLLVDRRHGGHPTTPPSLPSQGVFLQAWASFQDGVREDPSRFASLGFDMDAYFNLYNEDRVLKVRARYEGIIGSKERVPFDDWAQLAGPNLLRGYSRGRFLARHAGVASLEYRYSIAANMSAFLFTDLGIIADTWEQARPERWRVGYGGGLLFYSARSSFFALQFAGSEEGLYVNFSFAPATAETSLPQRLTP